MLFDDRLATVLRADISGDRSARTQFRQLLDLLGAASALFPGDLTAQAYVRLGQLGQRIPAEEQSRILREPGLRLRNAHLVAFLAEGEAKPAAAALATARLREGEWIALIPELPIVARGFLRHRRNLPDSAKRLLERLGVGDLVLPQPEGQPVATPVAEAEAKAPLPLGESERSGVRDLLRRIEAFRETRGTPGAAPRLPLGELDEPAAEEALDSFEFTSDAEGRIQWASGDFAAHVIGMRMARAAPGVIAALDEDAARRMHRFQPLLGAPLRIDGAPLIDGDWRVDAEPVFAASGGHFLGYRGRIRRPLYEAGEEDEQAQDTPADRMRQALHELRTPVNAIQGFAEIIQQQLFGQVPNEYRALAAAVSVDSAKLLAAFDEIDRLTRLESGALEIEQGECDLREVLASTIQRLEGALRPRECGLDLAVTGSPFALGIARQEVQLIAWRVLASLAGSLAPSEQLRLELSSDGHIARLVVQLPEALAALDDPLAASAPETRPAVTAGMFGTGFSLRLARAETLAAGGGFESGHKQLTLTLPLLTDSSPERSNGEWVDRAAGG